MNEIKFTSLDDSMTDIWPPGFEFESMFTIANPSYTVIVRSVKLRNSIYSINLLMPSASGTLIKYSEARFSPVSSIPSDCLRLASPSYYRNLETDLNSKLIRDDLESSYTEKKTLLDYANLQLEWRTDNFWMYCASIDPRIDYHRRRQMNDLSMNYNFGTKIDSASRFAEQLGRDIGRQVNAKEDLICNNESLYIIADFMKFNNCNLGDHIIFVDHGPVKYTNRIQEHVLSFPEEHRGSIIPFIKREIYAKQQEYRFCVSFQYHSPQRECFHFKVSDDLRNLMQPSEF